MLTEIVRVKIMGLAENELIANKISEHRDSGWTQLKYLWYTDLYRYDGKPHKKDYFHAVARNMGYRYTFLMRLCAYLSGNNNNVIKKLAFRLFLEMLRHISIQIGVQIAFYTKIGSGLYLPHPVSIVVHENAVIGKNCSLSHGVTIGQLHRGDRKGCPEIGDNVHISPGAVILGNIKIGNNVAIGANSVVDKDIPDNAVAAGVPARVISFKGSEGYINRVDY
jgi:serine O-acetyltransferase